MVIRAEGTRLSESKYKTPFGKRNTSLWPLQLFSFLKDWTWSCLRTVWPGFSLASRSVPLPLSGPRSVLDVTVITFFPQDNMKFHWSLMEMSKWSHSDVTGMLHGRNDSHSTKCKSSEFCNTVRNKIAKATISESPPCILPVPSNSHVSPHLITLTVL